MATVSYYFTLFKKFQVIDHVATQTVHGSAAPSGGFDLRDPNAPFTAANNMGIASLTAGDFIPANNPLWAILNSRASGNPGFTPVSVNGNNWPTMPTALLPEWTQFQVNPPPGQKLIDVFGHWISVDHQVKDIPNGVLANKPPNFAGPAAGVVPFVCSKAGDQGARPTALPGFWATSLIYLVDPGTGNTVNPGTMAAGAEYYLTAIVGNRGNTNGGNSLNQAQGLEFSASVMVWNTFLSPGVRLPALSNLSLTDTNGIYDQYFLRSGQYDVVGFRMNIQTVFNGIVAAINDAVANDGFDLGGLTAAQWVHNDRAHLCAKVVARLEGTAFPNLETSPEVDARIAQKNLAPFDITIDSTDPNPNIVWTNFLVGQPLFFQMKGAGENNLLIQTKLDRNLLRLYIAMPQRTYEQFVRPHEKAFKGVQRVEPAEFAKRHAKVKRALPFPAGTAILQITGDDPILPFGPMREGQMAAMMLGFEYDHTKLKHGTKGDITVAQNAMVPRLDKQGSHRVEKAVVGGFTLQVRVTDPMLDRKGQRMNFG